MSLARLSPSLFSMFTLVRQMRIDINATQCHQLKTELKLRWVDQLGQGVAIKKSIVTKYVWYKCWVFLVKVTPNGRLFPHYGLFCVLHTRQSCTPGAPDNRANSAEWIPPFYCVFFSYVLGNKLGLHCPQIVLGSHSRVNTVNHYMHTWQANPTYSID